MKKHVISSQVITSVRALIAILKSDKLVLDSENTTFTLVHYWLKSREEWTFREKEQAFDQIMKSDVLRFHHMDPHYLTAFAIVSPWVLSPASSSNRNRYTHQKVVGLLFETMIKSQGFEVRENAPIPATRAESFKLTYEF